MKIILSRFQKGNFEERHREINAKLKIYLRNHEVRQERNYDNFNINFNKQRLRLKTLHSTQIEKHYKLKRAVITFFSKLILI